MESEDYGRISIFLCSIFHIKGYSTHMRPARPASKQSVANTTSGGITVVNTGVLLSDANVLKAIKTLGNKAAQPAPKK